MENRKIKLIDYSKINQAISDYADCPFNLFVNEKYKGLVENEKGKYALVSEKYELTHPTLTEDDIYNEDELEDDVELELEYEVLFDIENDSTKKYKYTIPLYSLLEADQEEIEFKDFFRNYKEEDKEIFNDWIKI